MKLDRKVGVGFGIILLMGNKVLLGKRNEDPEKASSLLHGAGKWTLPGGKLHFGESIEEEAKREVMEETGIRLNSVKIIAVNNDMVETAHFVTIGTLSEDYEGEARVMEPDEITEWKWFELKRLPRPLYSPSEKLLNNYFKNEFYIPEKKSG